MKKPELLAPAGDFEKLKYALHYGADAVYCAGQQYGMRSNAGNFTLEELKEAAAYVHDRGKKIYVTVNISATNEDLDGFEDYIHYLKQIGIDHVIVADPGLFSIIRSCEPEMKISVSTQANTRNYQSCRFWFENGAKRVVLARELGLKEISEILEKKQPDLEIEMFVHGAMCISHSGRCLLSNYMTGRDANHGDCAQPCRWNYKVRQADLIEEKRPDMAFGIEEDERGTFIFNSKDLCLIDKVDELMKAGVDSFKIEGRMKSVYYVASVVHAYRQMIDQVYAGATPEKEKLHKELEKISHRDYTTAFYDRKTDHQDQNYQSSSYIRGYSFMGVVLDYDEEKGRALIEQRNKLERGDTIEVMRAGKKGFTTVQVDRIWDEAGNEIENTPHAKMRYWIESEPLAPMDLVRRQS